MIDVRTDLKKRGRIQDFFIKGFLLLGVASLVFTIFYLLLNLNISDKIIYKCIPGFILGLFSILAYGFLYPTKLLRRE